MASFLELVITTPGYVCLPGHDEALIIWLEILVFWPERLIW